MIRKEPTPEQCSALEQVYDGDGKVGYAIFYPQMGGYVGKAIAILDKKWTDNGRVRVGGCIDILIWHDGEFPFGDKPPIELHHCDPEQFIEFGESLAKLNERGRVEEAP